MWFELALPWWAWLVVGWVMASFCVAAGLARWFRWLRD
jgi:hypothetical protein